MTAAPVPDNEAERIQAVQALGILDTPFEERFDRITRVARRLFDVPTALITLVDASRQWAKSCAGFELREMPRDISFCAHAILSELPLVIPDATRDPRFADNPLVTGEPRIHFYAGYPLRGQDGHALGTLCLFDTRPRELSAEQRESLRDLAALATQELTMTGLVQALALQSQARVRLEQQTATLREQAALLDLADDAIMVRDRESRIIFWNRGAEQMYGWKRAEALGTISHQLLQAEFSEQLPAIDQRLRRDGRWEGEVIQTARDGRRLVVASRWALQRDTSGRAAAILEINSDVTAHKEVERSLIRASEIAEAFTSIMRELARSLRREEILRNIVLLGCDLTDSDLSFIALREESDQEYCIVATSGTRSDAFAGLKVGPGRGIAGLALAARDAATTDEYIADERLSDQYFGPVREEGLVSAVCVPVWVDGAIAALLFLGRRVRRPYEKSEISLASRFADHAALALRNARLYESLENRLTRLQTLSRLNQVVSSTLDMERVLNEIAAAAAQLVNAPVVTFWLYDEATQTLAARAFSDPETAATFPLRMQRSGEGSGGWIAAHREPLDVPDVFNDGRFGFLDWWKAHGLRSYYGVPVLLDGKLLAVLALNAPQPFNLGPDERNLIDSFVAQAAIAIRNAAQYRAVEQARSESRAVLDSTSEAIILVSPDRRFLSVNRRFSEIFGVPQQAVLGRRFDEFASLIQQVFVDPEAFIQRMAGTAADRERRFTEVVIQQWPERRDLELFSTPVWGPQRDYLGRLYVVRDVTREREVDRLKSEFVSLVSHELRTPLTSIKGYIDLILDGEVGEVQEEQREFLSIIANNADRLVALVNDLLDMSRIESGRIELQRAPLDLARLIHAVAESLRPQIELKGQLLSLDLPPELPSVLADSGRVTQIVTNLLSNAYKYTPAGGQLAVKALAGEAVVHIEVRDSGIGITQEEQSQLFTKFFRARNRAAQEAGGTGLGLAITRSLVELHGGTITVQSAPGAGSTFSFTLPKARGSAAAERGSLLRKGGRILVVEDEPDIANLVRRYLSRGGYQVLVAQSGSAALQIAEAERPDLITLDVNLPDVDGFTVLEWLKSRPATAAIPVVMLSMVSDVGRGRILGAVDYLTKPVDEQALLARVGNILADGVPRRVLVADDDRDIRSLLAERLRRAGYQVLEAQDGAEAVELARREHPGLVLLDIRMPGMDGIGALRSLRSDPTTCQLPVIMMTASPGALEENRATVAALGGISLLNKSLSAEELAAAITNGLGGTGAT